MSDFKLLVREATAADGPALAAIERRAPIVLGDTLMTFDRSGEYLAAARLMEDVTVVIAEVDGEPAAVEWAACHRGIVGGQECNWANYIHLRVADGYQGKGLWGALVNKLKETCDPKVDQGYQCAARENASIQRAFKDMPSWSVGPVRALLATNAQKAPEQQVRTASEADAERIVQLLNQTHGKEELYFPYTTASLCARLERAPDLYSWDQVWLTDNAVMGVWPAGKQTRVVRETAGTISESRNGLVLDFGFSEGAEGEFDLLLRAWCQWLAQHDHSHLSIFSSEPAAGYSTIRGLAEQLELFDIWTPPVPEPEGAAKHGVYVDQVYF